MLTRASIPNLLTFARVATVPLCLTLMVMQPSCHNPALFWIFIIASLTDFLDGYLARRWNAVSPLGTLLDPIADKLLVALMLLYLLSATGPVLLLPVALIMLRELYVSGLREFLASRRIALPVSRGGKWKTTLQMLAIAFLLAGLGWGNAPLAPQALLVGNILLYAAAALAVTSAVNYSRLKNNG